jgi:hypothetical protein
MAPPLSGQSLIRIRQPKEGFMKRISCALLLAYFENIAVETRFRARRRDIPSSLLDDAWHQPVAPN